MDDVNCTAVFTSYHWQLQNDIVADVEGESAAPSISTISTVEARLRPLLMVFRLIPYRLDSALRFY